MGRRTIGAQEVCGKFYNYGRLGPTRISYKEWLEHQGVLEESYIDSKLVKARLDFDLPDVVFKASEAHKLPENIVVAIATAIGIDARMEPDWPPSRRAHVLTKLKDRIKMAL